MTKIFLMFLIFSFLFNINFPVWAADEAYHYEESKQMNKQEINIWHYKMERITVRNEAGKWQAVQGINTELTDMQLLKLVNSENVATSRLKIVEAKQSIGSGLMLGGLALGLLGGIFVSDIIKVNNGFYLGIGGIAGALGLIIAGNALSPVISDETDHIITIDEARNAAEKYNVQLRKTYNLPDDIN
jgi:hypothetical protein